MTALDALIWLALLFVPSPLLAVVDRLRQKRLPTTPPSDEEGGRRVYEAWSRSQIAPADVYPPWSEMPDANRSRWRVIFRAAQGLPLFLLCLLFASGCLGGAQVRAGNRELAAALDSNALELQAFGKWDDERQLKIRKRCEEGRVGARECTRRLRGYQETRDHLRALLTKQIMSLELAVSLLGRDPDGTLSAEGGTP